VFFNLRYYTLPDLSCYESEGSSIKFRIRSDSESSKDDSFIVTLLTLILMTISFHCKITFNVLKKYKDSYKFLSEYIKRVLYYNIFSGQLLLQLWLNSIVSSLLSRY